jgi:hypothetical protein
VRAQSLQSKKFQVNIGMFICNKYNKLKCYVIVSCRLLTYDFNTVYMLRSPCLQDTKSKYCSGYVPRTTQ